MGGDKTRLKDFGIVRLDIFPEIIFLISKASWTRPKGVAGDAFFVAPKTW